MEHIRYKKETEVVTFQGKEITLENLSPVFIDLRGCWRYNKTVSSSVSFLRKGATI